MGAVNHRQNFIPAFDLPFATFDRFYSEFMNATVNAIEFDRITFECDRLRRSICPVINRIHTVAQSIFRI